MAEDKNKTRLGEMLNREPNIRDEKDGRVNSLIDQLTKILNGDNAEQNADAGNDVQASEPAPEIKAEEAQPSAEVNEPVDEPEVEEQVNEDVVEVANSEETKDTVSNDVNETDASQPRDFEGKQKILNDLSLLREASQQLAAVDRENKVGAFTEEAIDRVAEIIRNSGSAQSAIDSLYQEARNSLDVKGADDYLSKLKNTDDLAWAARSAVSVLSDKKWALEQVAAAPRSRRFVRHNGDFEKIIKKFNAEAKKLSKTGRKKKGGEPAPTKKQKIQDERERAGYVKFDEPGEEMLKKIGKEQAEVAEYIRRAADAADQLARVLNELHSAISSGNEGPSV